MLGYLVRRLLATIPVIGMVAFFVFSLLYLTPGDPAAVIAGDIATVEDIERIRQQLGLDQPLLPRFWNWASAVLHGDLGISIFTNLPVTQLIGQRVEPTLSLDALHLIHRGADRRSDGGHRGLESGQADRSTRDDICGRGLLHPDIRARLSC